MPISSAQAIWEGTLQQGKGVMKLGSGAYEGVYSFATRFEDAPGPNPEELIGAAHAGCFSMALSMFIEKAGHTPKEIRTRAEVNMEKVEEGFKITGITLRTEAEVPGMDADEFKKQAEAAKEGCPVSQALSDSIRVDLEASLKG